MRISILHYNDLTKDQLFEIFHLRTAVFVVEQNCSYQELDKWDTNCHHAFGMENDKIIAVGRIISELNKQKVIIGRIAIHQDHRNKGLARQLMKKIENHIINNHLNCEMEISAQFYLKEFYFSIGYKIKGEPYLEDGIPHICMYKMNNLVE